MAADTYVRNDKYRTVDPSSCKSRSGSGYAHTNDENHHYDAAGTDNCDLVGQRSGCRKLCIDLHLLKLPAQRPG